MLPFSKTRFLHLHINYPPITFFHTLYKDAFCFVSHCHKNFSLTFTNTPSNANAEGFERKLSKMRSLSTKASRPGLKGGDASAEWGEAPVSGSGGGCHPTRGRHSGGLNLKSSAGRPARMSQISHSSPACVTFIRKSAQISRH